MFFNPLFIDTNSAGAMQNQKGAKLGKSQYLFSDIIKISLSQNGSVDTEAAPSFNLSLIDNVGSISSLFSSINSNAVKSASNGSEESQNGDAILTNFLQFAFISQNDPELKSVDLKEIMKDKELLLSKESLTKSLSQLLQLYSPLTQSGNEDATQSADAENLAGSILQSIDDKGKAILNFNNNTSQIKIELTKLNNAEKELFISTKIIPMMISTNTESDTKGSTPTENTVANGASAQAVPQTVQSSENPQAVSMPDTAGTVNKKTKNVNKTDELQGKTNKNSSSESAQQTPAADSSSSAKVAVQTAPIVNETAAKAAAAELQAAKTVVKTEDNTAEKASAGSVKTEVPKTKNGSAEEYKMRVVEVNSESAPAEKETKIFTMTPFEKNLLKKASITYTSTENGSQNNVSEADSKQVQAQTTQKGETITTVEQAEKSILKSNTMLFEDTTEEAAVTKENTGSKEAASDKAPVVKKETVTENLKTNPDQKEIKQDTKTVQPEIGKQTILEINKLNLKEAASLKKVKTNEVSGNSEKQEQTETAKSAKFSVPVEDSKMKTGELKNEVSQNTTLDEKKSAIETENTSLKQDTDTAQKDSSNTGQSGSEKKGTESKQFVIQNVSDKEKITPFKDENLKEFARQAESAKTIKTYEIIKEIKSFIEQGNKSSMTLNIVPENLGSVKISLDMVKNMVQARIDVDSENVKQFVQNNIDTLKQSLNQSGVNVSMLQVNVSSSDQKQPRFASPHRKKGGGLGKEVSFEEADADVNKKILGYNSYDYLA